MERRPVDVVVMSDLHLGTYGCHAKEIVNYLKSIQPQILVLNGDVIDIWQFNKRYFPVAHMQVFKEIMSLLSKGTRVIYITGNHDEVLRRYSDIEMGNFQLTDKVVMEIDGKMTWIFHGDVFDVTMEHSKWLSKLGGTGYEILILLNKAVNWISKRIGKGKLSFSKKIKNSVREIRSEYS
jgi:UDP-2,3-diacylglucosamine pyrophosphatase LpxH